MIYRETTGRAKMHPRYVFPSSLLTPLHKREWESRASSLVTANYVSKRNSRADGKSLARRNFYAIAFFKSFFASDLADCGR